MSSMMPLLRLCSISLMICIVLFSVIANVVGMDDSARVTRANDATGIHDDDLNEIQKTAIHQQVPDSNDVHSNRNSNEKDPKTFKQDSSDQNGARKEMQEIQEVSRKAFPRAPEGSKDAELDQEDVLLQKMAILKQTVDAVRPKSTVELALESHAEMKERSKSLVGERGDNLQEQLGKLGVGIEKQSKDEETRKPQQDQNLEDSRVKSSMRESKRTARDVPTQRVEAGEISKEKVIEVGGDSSKNSRSESQSQKKKKLDLKSQEKAHESKRKNDLGDEDPLKNDEKLKQSGTARAIVTPGTIGGDQQLKQGQEQQRSDLDSTRTSSQEDNHALGTHGSVSMRKQGQGYEHSPTATDEIVDLELQRDENQPDLQDVSKHGVSSDTSHNEKRSGAQLETRLEKGRQSGREQGVEENAGFHQQESEQEEKEVDFTAEEQHHQDKEQQQTTPEVATERNSVPEQVQEGSENTDLEHTVEHERQSQEENDTAANGDEKSAIPEEEEPFVFPEPYLLGPPIKDWDEQRANWLEANPHQKTTSKGKPRVLIVTGSQPEACRSPIGDFFHIRSLKMKIDYARMHDYELYYNFVWLDPLFGNYWVKLPTVRKLMLTHPEIEWIFWVDSDAIFTDMLFEAPFDQYDKEGANMVMWAYEHGFYVEKSWLAFNAGVFILRNCQWSLDLIDKWSPMGPGGRVQEEYGKILTEYLTEREENYPADDQSALAYIILTNEEISAKVKFVDFADYMISVWWVEVVHNYEENLDKYHPGLGDKRWPWITHFTGCGPCNGNPTTDNYGECMVHVDRALNFADNQVLAYMGYQHDSLSSHNVTRVRAETQRPIDFVDYNPWEERMAKVASAAS